MTRSLESVPLQFISSIQAITKGRRVGFWPSVLPSLLEYTGASEVISLDNWDTASTCDVVMCIQPAFAREFINQSLSTKAISLGALFVTWSDQSSQSIDDVPYFSSYRTQEVQGFLLHSTMREQPRVAALHGFEILGSESRHLLMWSSKRIPALSFGIYAHGQAAVVVPDRSESTFFLTAANRSEIHARLAGRLLDVEDRTVELRGELLRLKAQVSEGRGQTSASYFDVPKTTFTWPLAEDPSRPPDTLKLYDRRPNDAVIISASLGVEFMDLHGLLSDSPDYKSAVETLNKMSRALTINEKDPDVTIVVPVYGQFSYTLNCLDALFRHKSKHTAEILIIDDCSPDTATAEFGPTILSIRYHRQRKNGGFIRSCNTGGEMAQGQYIVMLNSDTRVVDGWLDELVDSFQIFPKAGLVGSKMFYSDGSLQEAGGILWRDGGAWNYGRNDDPNRPQYSYARKVDYISGCSLILRTALWRQLCGFDPHFTPAYCEDADLCQRVMATDHEVWFQPLSRVVHYEGKTSGTSTSSGVKAYQLINLKKLFLRWRLRFEHYRPNAQAAYFEKERYVHKRILFVDAVTPTPNQDAGSLQTVLGLRCAISCGYKVHFVPEDNWLFEPGYTPHMQREGIDCAYAPYEVGFENYISRYGFLFDVIVIYRVGVMQKSLKLVRQHAPNSVLLFHLADLHFLRMKRQAELEGDSVALHAAMMMKEKELSLVSQSDCTITHSTVEEAILKREVPEAATVVWPLMMEAAGTAIPFESRRDICFLGGYRHPPNVDAVMWFISEVWPLIQRQLSDVRFIIAGANPPLEFNDFVGDRVTVTGLVDNLAEVFDKCRIFVCPLRVGAGAKGKIMSALSYGLPIVSTGIGVEGAGLTDGEHVLVANGRDEMAAAVTRLYNDSNLWSRLSTAGLSLVKDDFSLSMGEQKLRDAVDKGWRHRLAT